MKRIMFTAAVLLLLLLPASAKAASQLVIIGQFQGGGNEFDIAQYTEDKEKVALIGIAINDQRTSVAFDPNEWHSFVELWQRARGVQTATWQFIGTFKETGTDEQAQLSVSAGPEVQFTITGKKGPFVFMLSPGDYAGFDTAVGQMTQWVAQR